MDKKINNLIKELQKRNIEGIFCSNKEKAVEKILEIIPREFSVGISGSKTLDELGVIKAFEATGRKFFNQYQAGLSRGESLELRKQGARADYYLASANAISESGEMVFFSAYGNRTAGVAYCKTTIIVCGMNKITPDLNSALKRAREYVTPLNCQRLNWQSACFKDGVCRKEICYLPEFKRMCCQIMIIEAEAVAERLKVILVGENLGI